MSEARPDDASRVRVRGVDLHVEAWGSGPTLVVAHGLLGSVELAGRFGVPPRAYADHGLRVVAYDARGHGRSGFTAHEADYRWASHAADLAELLRALGLRRVSLLGGSMGAGSALLVALAGPPTAVGPADVQFAVEKGLFFLEHQSMRWWKSKKCATCHEGQALLLGANAAKARGVPVDQGRLDFWTERWVMVDALAFNDKRKQLNGLGMDTAPYVFLYRDPARDDPAPDEASRIGSLMPCDLAVASASG